MCYVIIFYLGCYRNTKELQLNSTKCLTKLNIGKIIDSVS